MLRNKIVFAVILFSLINLFHLFSEPLNRKLRIVEEGGWPPFTFEKEGSPTRGIAVELAEAVFSRLDAEYDMKLLPQKRMLKYLEEGSADVITVISRNHERDLVYDYTDPVFSLKGLILYSSERPEPVVWDSYEDLKKYRIGIVIGYNYGEKINQAIKDPSFTFDTALSQKHNLDKLKAGRIDIMLITDFSLSEYKHIYPEYVDTFRIAEKPYITYNFHLAFSKKTEARKLIPEVDRIIRDIRGDGTLKGIFRKYNFIYNEPDYNSAE